MVDPADAQDRSESTDSAIDGATVVDALVGLVRLHLDAAEVQRAAVRVVDAATASPLGAPGLVGDHHALALVEHGEGHGAPVVIDAAALDLGDVGIEVGTLDGHRAVVVVDPAT